jgi:peptide/nickel transport system substrate-binding protein
MRRTRSALVLMQPYRARSLTLALLLALGLLAVGGSASGATVPRQSGGSGTRTGGTLTVAEPGEAGEWPLGLDPATDTSDLGDAQYMDAIYGDLLQQTSTGAVTPDLATGYSIAPGAKELTLYLRQGVTFQDGTPFNAQAVAYNISRDLEPKYACICDSSFPVASITTPTAYTVVLHLSKPFSPIAEAFPGSAPNWIISPTALAKMGETKFAESPVGAGPFEVVSDSYNSQLVLKRNPHYWQHGRPYLNQLIYKSVADDETAYTAVLANNVQAAQMVQTPSVARAAESKLEVTTEPGRNAVNAVQLNTTGPPFNNILAREAIYYASDAAPISKGLGYGYGVVSQSPSFPGTPFSEAKVPGYRSYDLAKAKALVKQLGGLHVDFSTPTGAIESVAEALESQWEKAGIQVTFSTYPTLTQVLQAFLSNKWQAMLQGGGGLNPALGVGGSYWRYYSSAPFTGTHDTKLDQMIDQAAASVSVPTQANIYKQIYQYLSKEAYLPMLFATPWFTLAERTVHGPGMTTPLGFAQWESVWLS